MRIARPLLLVWTPIGVVLGLREAWRLAGPKMTLLMAVMLSVVGAFLFWTVRRIRQEQAAARSAAPSDDSRTGPPGA
jgi:hypothetical protein